MDMIRWCEKQRTSLQIAHDECQSLINGMLEIDPYWVITEHGKIVNRIFSEVKQTLGNIEFQIAHLSGPRIFINAGTKSDDTDGKAKPDKSSGRKKARTTK